MTWSRHSRRIEPITRSAYGFCHGLTGLQITSATPIPATRRTERVSADAISISEQPPWRRVIRKRLDDLLHGPVRRRMLGDVDVDDASASVGQQDQYEQQATDHRRDREEVHGHDRGQMIGQERSATLVTVG